MWGSMRGIPCCAGAVPGRWADAWFPDLREIAVDRGGGVDVAWRHMETPSSSLSRRRLLTTGTLALAAGLPFRARAQAPAAAAPAGPFTLAPLPYDPAALEPHIDAQTMGIHHGKHHKAYVDNLNKAIAGSADLQKKSIEELIGGIPFLPADIQKAVQNNGGGHWNHTLFWSLMAAPGAGVGGEAEGTALGSAIGKAFGSFAKFREKFSDAAMKRFGSGWAWLIVQPDGGLAVVSTANQDNPLMQGVVPNGDRGQPVLALDVWEHAYYLKYQNKRADYVAAWFNVVNWKAADALYAAATAAPKKGGK